MSTASAIAEKLGKARIAERVGRPASAVSNAIKRGVFPAPWRPVIEEMAREKNVSVSDEVFYSVHAISRGRDAAAPQGDGAGEAA